MNIAYNEDCLAAMKKMPDKAFDLAVVDPPYGGGSQKGQVERKREKGLRGGTEDFERRKRSRFGSRFDKYYIGVPIRGNVVEKIPTGTTGAAEHDIRHWDVAPPPEYFEQLARVSKNQIIFGANYFPDMPPTRCFIVFRKLNIPLEGFSMSPVEFAWTSFNDNAKMFEAFTNGGPGKEDRFHPTQKPIELYTCIYNKFAKPGDKILDTHLGSGSSRIAAWKAGLDFVGYEIDKYYFDKQEERFSEQTAQAPLFNLFSERR